MGDCALTGSVLLDVLAAFDLIDRNLLLLKLKCYNFSDNAINLIKSYLGGKISTVCINSTFLTRLRCLVGCHMVATILFSSFVNDQQS